MSRLPDSSETTTTAPDAAPTLGDDTAARPTATGGSPGGGRERSNRAAALIATAVALPATVLAGVLAFNQFASDQPESEPGASATAPGPLATAPVEMAAPDLAERPATVCRALLSQLPPTIRELPQRPVTAGPEQNAAYGDPALTVACGGAAPAFADTDKLWLVNRVCWYGSEAAGSTVLSTVDRETTVTVRVPDGYDQPLQWVSPISETITATVPSVADAPAGCRPA